MVDIEHRVETTTGTPDYAGRKFSEREVAADYHRTFVGGEWDTHGAHQLEFLKAHGLQPSNRFIDVGAGAFRAGRYLIDYLERGNYYAVDANLSLLETGYEAELTAEQRERLPVGNLRANDRFDTDFGVPFDMAIAQSVFTHLSLNHLRLCLFRLAKTMRPGGTFYVTFFEQPKDTPLDAVVRRSPEGRPKFYERNVFWYYRDDLRWAARGMPWSYRYIGAWGHPRGQRMVEYTRTQDRPTPASRPDEHSLGYRGRRWLARHIAPPE
jgi:SAM-dependent methyltransferase